MSRSPYARPTKSLNSEMNVVPYIDVMLVLLIIFMVTAPMLTTGVEVNLPKEKTATISTQDRLPVIISMRADGALYMSHEGVMDKQISMATLADELMPLAEAAKNPTGESTLQVMINADATNPYSNIMQLMASLQQLGITKVGLLSDAPNPNATP